MPVLWILLHSYGYWSPSNNNSPDEADGDTNKDQEKGTHGNHGNHPDIEFIIICQEHNQSADREEKDHVLSLIFFDSIMKETVKFLILPTAC